MNYSPQWLFFSILEAPRVHEVQSTSALKCVCSRDAGCTQNRAISHPPQQEGPGQSSTGPGFQSVSVPYPVQPLMTSSISGPETPSPDHRRVEQRFPMALPDHRGSFPRVHIWASQRQNHLATCEAGAWAEETAGTPPGPTTTVEQKH